MRGDITMSKKLKDPSRVSGIEKLSQFLINFGNMPEQSILGAFLLYFYINICGMDATRVGTLILVTKFLDGVNDPIMGFVLNRLPKTKAGRFRPYIFIGMVVLSINLYLVFAGPLFASGVWKYVIAYITYTLIGFTFDLTDIPKNAVFVTATNNPDDRGSLSIWRTAGMLIGGTFIGIIAPEIIAALPEEKDGYMLLVYVSIAIMLIFTFVGSLGIKERVVPVEERRATIRETLRLYALRPVLITLLASLLLNVLQNLVGGISVHYAVYILGDMKYTSLASVITLFGTFPGFIITPYLARKVDGRVLFAGSGALMMVGCLVRFLAPSSVAIYYLSTFFHAVGIGAFIIMASLFLADNNNYVEYKMGIRSEAMLSSNGSFVTKVATAIGSALPAYVLGFTGFDEKLEVQSEATMNAIVFCASWLPIIVGVLAIVVIFLYPVDRKKNEEIMEELNRRASLNG